MTKQIFYRITVLSLLLCQVGSVIVVQADNHPAKVVQADQVASVQYLPIVYRPFTCPDYFDDFSNPASGWFVGEDNKFLSEYLNGEYRVLVKRSNSSYIFDAPTCKRINYTVEVDARWIDSSNKGTSYGLMLGTVETPRQFYSLELKPDTQEFTIYSYGRGGWELIVSGSSTAIQTGAAPNHLVVTHRGGTFSAEVFNTHLYTWDDTTDPGEKGLGLIVASYPNQGNADARFDNFRVINIYR
jgi:hypothetical protein